MGCCISNFNRLDMKKLLIYFLIILPLFGYGKYKVLVVEGGRIDDFVESIKSSIEFLQKDPNCEIILNRPIKYWDLFIKYAPEAD